MQGIVYLRCKILVQLAMKFVPIEILCLCRFLYLRVYILEMT